MVMNFSDPEVGSTEGDNQTAANIESNMYEPYSNGYDSGGGHSRLLTGQEKISELQQILEERDLELDELKVQGGANMSEAMGVDNTLVNQISHEMNCK